MTFQNVFVNTLIYITQNTFFFTSSRKQEPLHNEKLAKVVVSKMDSFFTDDVVSSQCILILP